MSQLALTWIDGCIVLIVTCRKKGRQLEIMSCNWALQSLLTNCYYELLQDVINWQMVRATVLNDHFQQYVSYIVVDETEAPRENQRPATIRLQTLSHNVV